MIMQVTPILFDSAINFHHTIQALNTACNGVTLYKKPTWSNGGNLTQDLTVVQNGVSLVLSYAKSSLNPASCSQSLVAQLVSNGISVLAANQASLLQYEP